MKKQVLALLVASLTLVVVGDFAGALADGSTRDSLAAAARPNPSDFSANVTNQWYPLKPGTTYVYRGVKDGKALRDVMTVTRRTKKIEGVPCVVINDRVYLNGHLGERTTDWYTQDTQGNVWYFGESTAELNKKGHVTSTAGSWMAGVHGAKPGIYMFAHPKPGRAARQEFYKGQAEDHFRVVSLNAKVKVPYVSSKHALLTKEWTPLEPGVIDHKLYVRGIGTVIEQTVKGGAERAKLISVTRSS
jgi:hypothetical protein